MKNKFAILISLILTIVLLVILYWLLLDREPRYSGDRPSAHHAQLPKISLSNIQITAYYFVPRDMDFSIDPNWNKELNKRLYAIKNFYETQTNLAVGVGFRVYPEIVIGKQDSDYYSHGNTNYGNPNALLETHREILPLHKEYSSNIVSNNTFEVLLIMYEGDGASSMLLTETPKKETQESSRHVVELEDNTIPAMLVSSYFTNGPRQIEYGDSIFAHEFGHLIGLEDEYSYSDNQPSSNNIMGMGRYRPLKYTHLDNAQLRALGVLDSIKTSVEDNND